MVRKKSKFRKQLALQLFVLAGIIYIFIFNYIPMFGLVIAFRRFDIIDGIGGMFTAQWIGFAHFREFFGIINFWQLVENTVGISVLKMIFAFPVPIIFAIMLSEMRTIKYKRVVQTCSYLPHFISWVIVAGISFRFLSLGGIINSFLTSLRLISEPIPFLSSPDHFWGLAVVSDIWKSMGWWTIIFLAAIVGVSSDLYEAAKIDGAGRMKRIWYITLPCIKPTIVIVLILALGNLLGGGLGGSNFEQSFLLGNALNAPRSDIIQTYVFRVGLAQGRVAYATAVGLVQSIISLLLILSSNFAAKKISGTGLF